MREIEYFYSAHSAFAYLGARRLREIATAHDCKIIHRPIALSPVVEAVGGLPFAGRTRAHVDYFFGREIERWSEMRGVEIVDHRPTHHDNALELSNGMLIAAVEQDADVTALSEAILQAHWRNDADLANPDHLRAAALSVNVAPDPLLDVALSAPIQHLHHANTSEAISRSVFGSPAYFLDGELFYGQDRLEVLERALTAPFRPARFRNP